MKFKRRITVECNVKYLQCKLGVRYWEDAIVNGVEDTEGTLIPLRNGDYWQIVIEFDTVIIQNWRFDGV
jgi:hypothetical protein